MRHLVVVGLLWIGLSGSAHAEPNLACHVPAAATKLTVEFQPETSLRDLAVWVMGFTCKNVVFAADVAKHATKVHVLAPSPMTSKQALQLFVDAVEATGMLVTVKPETIIITLGPKLPRGCPDLTAAAMALPPIDLPTDPPVLSLTDAQLDAGIRVIDDTHVELTAAVRDALLINPMTISRGGRMVPSLTDGKPDGLKLYAIRPSSVFARLGLRNGDRLRSINGQDISTPDAALEAYTLLRDAKRLEIGIVRGGKPLTQVITIK
jgi:PDZ domain